MDINYRQAESMVKPDILEITSDTVYIRKNINTIERENGSLLYYIYDEAQLTLEEYGAYINFLINKNAIKGANDSDNIVKVMANQESGDENQLAIMEAIADLYDMIATLGLN